MEGTPKKKGVSRFENAGRAVIASIALLGAVGANESPAEAATPQSQEQQETFNSEKEATAFIEEIAALDVGIDDARGRHTLKIKIEEDFNVFALALDGHIPYFSSGNTHASLNGSVTPEIREKARQYLLPKVLSRSDTDNPAIEILKSIVSGTPGASSIISPELKKKLGDW
jgi:hypothetical protein